MEQHLRLYSPKEVIDLYHAGRKIYGASMPPPHPKKKKLPANDHYRGLMAENAVSGLLNLITLERNSTFVFHSIGEQGEGSKETDHILLYKRLLLIIETKNRASVKEIKIRKNGNTYAKRSSGQSVSYSNSSLSKKIKDYKKAYPFLQVEGILVVHHDLEHWSSDIQEITIVTVPELLPLVLNKIDNEKNKPADTAAIVKDIATRCIRNEQID